MSYGDIYGNYYVSFKESLNTVILTPIGKLFQDTRAVICKDGIYGWNLFRVYR